MPKKKEQPYFPLFVDLSGKKVYVVGAGTIAKRRIRSLIDFTGKLTVIAPEVNPELHEMERMGEISILKKKYESSDIFDADLVIAATNDHTINEDIYRVCKERGILVNVCSDKKKCDFYFPGLAIRDNVVVGVTANGTNHKKARLVVEKIREMMTECW
ncbi:MAG: bifunctional precorrin-2 dehydrogenase/sirohydrochlorin ferrochelatase [Eubacteriales bacterium]|nr:bifunctional precorrin-2 dehydrogenase/sirohydrochlorin ferrochelatase [Eubacteriales bacterium]